MPNLSRRTLLLGAASFTSIHSVKANDLPELSRKFSQNGVALPFRGNTIIIPLTPESSAATLMMQLNEALLDSPILHRLRLLPPSSFHMTIFEGVNDHDRQPYNWPQDCPSDTSIHEATLLAIKALRQAPFDYPQPILMRPHSISLTNRGVSMKVVGFDNTQNQRIRDLRDQIADRLAIHRPNHAHYGFHMTLAYTIDVCNPTDLSKTRDKLEMVMAEALQKNLPLALGAPQFCTYDNMLEFTPLFSLPRKL